MKDHQIQFHDTNQKWRDLFFKPLTHEEAVSIKETLNKTAPNWHFRIIKRSRQ
ncbi:MAG: hypothetical protein KGI28_01580 [Thaumarchaeota archaeon]|nr:hypothetical protein [Nitrososphaerota archaeon]